MLPSLAICAAMRSQVAAATRVAVSTSPARTGEIQQLHVIPDGMVVARARFHLAVDARAEPTPEVAAPVAHARFVTRSPAGSAREQCDAVDHACKATALR